MLDFLRRFSNSPKHSDNETRFGQLFTKPELDLETQSNLKKRLLNQIYTELREDFEAQTLDRQIAGKKIKATGGMLDFLASVVEALLNLPKVLPERMWQTRTRENFEGRAPRRFFIVLRQATAFAMLLIVGGGITLTSFITQTQTAVAQLAVSSGVVQVREAQSTFFEEVAGFATIRLGDTIRVGVNSTADLSFYDASKMHLTASTEVSITEFSPNYISREKSGVKVAVLSGSVNAEVAAKEDSSFQVETSTGSVEAQNAKFSVAINPQTGSTKIQSSEDSEDVVAVKSSKNSESVALIAGEAVIFADPASEMLVSKNASGEIELPSITKIASEAEFIKIRSFDALVSAQDGDVAIANKIRAGIEEKLDSLLIASGVAEIHGGGMEALQIFVSKNYLVGEQRAATLANLQQAGEINQILNYYFVSPRFLKGVPEFEILANSSFTPSGKLRNLFAVLRAKQLAHTEIHATIDTLAARLTLELAENLRRQNLTAELAQILQRMENQPIFLSVLTNLQSLIPIQDSAVVEKEIQTLEQRIQKYAGA
ncbi:FecR domain-containing protein [Candidatus Gracilibacteria bacterium]|nr:FecR domain-containing protein [Candidatus Gracilibacteria bacterium]MCF7856177.1 FecR domain-containing protein [Candidatus Gracilibacteria bacterium]MCF7896449.1 FecR domain-containing protein [Candidatus Gracilibacteria bacterium]